MSYIKWRKRPHIYGFPKKDKPFPVEPISGHGLGTSRPLVPVVALVAAIVVVACGGANVSPWLKINSEDLRIISKILNQAQRNFPIKFFCDIHLEIYTIIQDKISQFASTILHFEYLSF